MTIVVNPDVQKIKSERAADGLDVKEQDILTLIQSVRISAVDTSLPEDASPYVIHPEAYLLRNFWDPLLRFLALGLFMEVPFMIAFHPEIAMGVPFAISPA
jgi:hypothetical protein